MSVSLKRLSILSIAAILTVAACGSSGATSAPRPRRRRRRPRPPRPRRRRRLGPGICSCLGRGFDGARERFDQRLGLVHRRAHLDRRRRGAQGVEPRLQLTIEGPGTGDGFKRFCAGEIDIADASRPIKRRREADLCTAAGIEYVELKIAYRRHHRS